MQDTKQTILNEYGNPKQHFVDEVVKAELAWRDSLKPVLDRLSLVDCRILLNYAHLGTQNSACTYLLIRQIREKRAKRAMNLGAKELLGELNEPEYDSEKEQDNDK